MGFLCIAQLTLVRATGGCLNYTKWVPFFLIAVKLFAIDTSNTKVSTDINMVAMQKKDIQMYLMVLMDIVLVFMGTVMVSGGL